MFGTRSGSILIRKNDPSQGFAVADAAKGRESITALAPVAAYREGHDFSLATDPIPFVVEVL